MAEIGGTKRARTRPRFVLGLLAVVVASASCRVEVHAGNAPPPPAQRPAALPANIWDGVAPLLECENERPLWMAAPMPAPPGGVVPRAITQALAASNVRAGTPREYGFTAKDIANENNSDAVRRDAAHLVDGSVVIWSDGGQEAADVYVEQFDSDAAALAFQHDHAEDHCYMGDRAFTTPAIPGGIGFRCRCTATTVTDRVAFARGPFRVQVIEWSVPETDGHDAAIRLGKAALDLAEHGSTTTLDPGVTS